MPPRVARPSPPSEIRSFVAGEGGGPDVVESGDMGPAVADTVSAPVDLAALVVPTLPGLQYETWNYGDSVAFEALLAGSDMLEQERWAAFAHGWARAWATRARPYVRSDCTAPGLAITHLAARFADGRLFQAAVDLAGYLLGRPTLDGVFESSVAAPLMHPYGPATLNAARALLVADPPPGVFVDCLHFDPPFFAGLAAATGDGRYLDAALQQACGYVRLLQRPDGLFDHFVLRGVPGRFGGGWGRGQGWALLGLLDVLAELRPLQAELTAEQSASWAEIDSAAGSLVHAMAALQRPDGHWFAVASDPHSGEEHSTAAFMAAGFHRALTAGVVAGADIERAATAAYRATCAAVNADGMLTEVTAAVMACTEPSHYAHVPRGFLVPWGQGPAVLAAAARQAWCARG